MVSDIFSSRTPSLSSSPGDTTPPYTPQRRISIEHPSGVLEIGLTAAESDSPRSLDIAHVERSVALIAHARVYYTMPDRHPSVEIPIISPVTPTSAEMLDRAYQSLALALGRGKDRSHIIPLGSEGKESELYYNMPDSTVSSYRGTHSTAL